MRTNVTILILLFLFVSYVNAQILDRPVSLLTPVSQSLYEKRCNCVDIGVENAQQGIYYLVRKLNDKIVLSDFVKGNGQNISINAGAVDTTSTLEVIAYQLDKSLKFDGINDYFLLSSQVNTQFPLTISARIKTTDSDGVIVGFTGAGVNNYMTFSVYQGHLRLSTGNGTTMEYIDGVAAINNNTWHHVAAVIETGQVHLYVNGTLDKTASYTKPPVSTTKNSIGGAYLNDFLQGLYAGLMDDLTIWNTALDATAISNLTTNNPAGNEPNLVINYTFDGMPDSALLSTGTSPGTIYAKPYGIGNAASIIDTRLDSLKMSANITVNVNTNHSYGFLLGEICPGDPFGFDILATNCNYNYLLRNNADNTTVSGPVLGTGGSISMGVPALNSELVFNVLMRQYDQSLSFDGTDDYIQTSPMIPLTDTFTIMARIKSTDGSGTIFGWGGNGVNNYAVLEIYQSHLRFACGESSANKTNIDGNAIINDDNWHHVAIVRTGNSVSLYVNGNLDKSDDIISAPIPTYSSIGAGYMNGMMQDNYSGLINDLSIWNKALTSNQIKCFSETKPWGNDKGLIAYYNFDNLPAANLVNRNSDNYHGSFFNMPVLSVINPSSAYEIELDEKINTSFGVHCNVGIKDNTGNNSVLLHPNPSNGIIKINTYKQIQSVQVKNSNGTIIKEMKPNTSTIDISNYPAGIYFITLKLTDGVITQKIIKK